MKELIIENISSADKQFLDLFYKEINSLDKQIIKIINAKKLKIILANKLSDIYETHLINKKISEYTDYDVIDRNVTTRGLCSDTINAICIFSKVTKHTNIGAILYHEIGHIIDRFWDWDKANYSNKEEFLEAYKKDLLLNWDRIKCDNRFRLVHFVQNSTLENISLNAASEVFAHSFGVINDKHDDKIILELYFRNSIECARQLYKKFFSNIKF